LPAAGGPFNNTSLGLASSGILFIGLQ